VIKIPGMVDPHVHLRGMEWSHKGTFASETAAAVAGGYWAVLDMPNTQPSTIDRPALERKLAEFGIQSVCDWGVYFGAAMSENWRCYDDVIDDVCGLKIYNNATTGTLLIDDQRVREQHYRAWPGHKMIAVHAEGETVLDILALVRAYRKKTHFCHISTAEEIRYLTDAKAEGLPVTIGVCPHHLYLTQDDVPRLGPLGLMKPELKTKADQQALWEALESGVVDVVESDHAPHTLEEKFSGKPVYGVPGLETTLPLLCLAVRKGRLSMERVIELVATNPRRIFGLDCPAETYTLVDVDESFIIERGNLHTLCGWSPFEGMRVYGRVKAVNIRGERVFDGETIRVANGFGQNLYGV
jgi:carbamoyl-phosphate synthase/aspartate carbamoyltransferase/dihydroorotase